MSTEEPQPDPGTTMDKGFMVGAVVGLIILTSISSVASCLRGEAEQTDQSSNEEQSSLMNYEDPIMAHSR